jgi:hypothetical protein
MKLLLLIALLFFALQSIAQFANEETVSYDFDKDGKADSCRIIKTADSIRLV